MEIHTHTQRCKARELILPGIQIYLTKLLRQLGTSLKLDRQNWWKIQSWERSSPKYSWFNTEATLKRSLLYKQCDKGWCCGAASPPSHLQHQHPTLQQPFHFWLLHFQSSFLLRCLGRTAEDGPNTWATAIPMGEPEGVSGSWSTFGCCRHLRSKPKEECSLSHILPVTFCLSK